MKKRVLIFLLLIMVNTLPIYAMYSPQNQCGRTMGKNLSSGTGSCLTGDSDSDSDSDEEPSMPTLGDDSDGEEDARLEPEDTEFLTPPRGRCDYLDLAVPFGKDIDEVVLPSSAGTWTLNALETPSTGGGSRFGSASSPLDDIEPSPLPPSKLAASVGSDYFGQGLSKDVVDCISKRIDSLFLPPDGHAGSISPPLLPEDDLVLPMSHREAVASEVAAESSVVVVPHQDLHVSLAAPLAGSGAGISVDATWYEREFNAAITEANRSLNLCQGIVDVKGDTIVVGDLHGDLKTFREIAKFISVRFESNEIQCVVFLGDIMDRGENSARTLLELVQFFNKYKGRVYIVRGNHETREMYLIEPDRGDPNFEYIFNHLARNDPLLKNVNQEMLFGFFDNLPHAAIINGATLAVHGGVPAEEYWAKFRERKKCKEIDDAFTSGGIHGALWSDYTPWLDCGNASPYINFSFQRGGGTLCFNEAEAKKFLEFMGCKYMIRAHQPSLGTFHRSPNGVITTVFSALENQGFPCVNMALVSGRPAEEPYATIWITG